MSVGQTICLGDFRRVLAQQTSHYEVERVEKRAGTETMNDNSSFSSNNIHSLVSKAMREHFPQTGGGYGSLSFTFTPGEAAATMLLRSRQEYTAATDCSPDNNDQHKQMFRKAIMAAIPAEIKTLMEDNPEIDHINTQTWERHLAHHIGKFNKQLQKNKTEEEELRVQLLRTQLDIARKTIQNEKKGVKQLIVHPVAPAGQAPGPQNPQGGFPHPGQSHNQAQYDNNGFQQQRGGFRGKTRGRGGFETKAGGNQEQVCFTCGQADHWYRWCPQGLPQRGRGAGAQRGHGQGNRQEVQHFQQQQQAAPQAQHQEQGHIAPNAMAAPYGQFVQNEQEYDLPQ